MGGDVVHAEIIVAQQHVHRDLNRLRLKIKIQRVLNFGCNRVDDAAVRPVLNGQVQKRVVH